VDKLIEILGAAGYPSTIVGGVVFLFFYLRKQEAVIRNATKETIDSLEEELERRKKEILRLEALIISLRLELTTSQDESIVHRRRAEAAEAKIKRMES